MTSFIQVTVLETRLRELFPALTSDQLNNLFEGKVELAVVSKQSEEKKPRSHHSPPTEGRCVALLTSGKNKGGQCGYTAKGDDKGHLTDEQFDDLDKQLCGNHRRFRRDDKKMDNFRTVETTEVPVQGPVETTSPVELAAQETTA